MIIDYNPFKAEVKSFDTSMFGPLDNTKKKKDPNTYGIEDNRPLLNEFSYFAVTGVIANRPQDYKLVVQYVRNSPELLGVFNALITDISSDSYYFLPYDKELQGKKGKIEKAYEFCRKNFFKEQFRAGLMDWLMLGNAAFWIGINDIEPKMREKLKEILETKELKHLLTKEGLDIKQLGNEWFDEEFNELRTFQNVAWSTMSIKFTNRAILGYYQSLAAGGPIVDPSGKPIPGKISTGGIPARNWEPKEIIHARYMPFDGKVYGYTPTFALMPVISTLQLTKHYAGLYFDRGAIPDHIFKFPKEQANSPNIKDFEQKLETFNNYGKNFHGNMLVAGEVDDMVLNDWNKDMEFRKLVIYLTAVIATAFNMPMGRLQSILGMEIKSADSDISNESYWRTISSGQDYWEDLFNSQLFIPYFGVIFKLKRSYKQDDIRETQALMQKLPAIAQMNSLLANYGEKLSKDYVYELLGIDHDSVEEGAIEDPNQGNQGLDGKLNNNNVSTLGDAKRSKMKKGEQAKTEDKRGYPAEGKEISEEDKLMEETTKSLTVQRLDLLKTLNEKLKKGG